MTIAFMTLAAHHRNNHGPTPGDLVAVELPPTWRPLSSAVDAMVEADRVLGNVLAMLQAASPVVELPDGSHLHRSPSDALRELARRYFREGNLCMNDSTEAELDRWFDELWKKEKLP